ncbi:c-type cytochrome [Candidatus Macondimonas diazotrophica]|jgi:cytochrome c556|uniref:Cytochrome c n=1 Tax=Candidatus Macondimonas diazotrophica TaxID=2305248 RepID=A0A4Z0F7M5_9GAMM|nr:cytochrome c [Candidatus Macondimonas diazotrophica]NCU01687.1 cytochrome c [Candidatus Macondimonas diazotrophica]TFZ81728.1 cytochrome c [Candidatus Macondimonas diazotrophica]HBG29886.1 cytochrome C [Gammaproteobacteria bacterium]HBG51657.1 cytochrome C [Gammaproteobacteria bacterium]
MKPLRIALALSLMTPFLASAHGGDHADPIRYRQSGFYLIGWHFEPMAAMVKGEMPMDTKDFAAHAAAVSAVAPLLTAGFANGPHKGKSDAKAEIWKNPADFAKKMEAFQNEAAQLAEVAQVGDTAKIKGQFMNTAKTCKACHDDYRKD